MPFDNFYEESDKARRRWWKCVGAACLLLVGYWTFALLAIPDQNPYVPPPEKSYLAGTFPYHQIQQRVDDTCASLPTPEGFRFDSKTQPIAAARRVSINYTFRSSRAKAEIFPIFIVWFNANGWTDDKRQSEYLEFSKGNQSVRIAPYSAKPYDYFAISCAEQILE